MGNCFRHQSSTQWGGDDWGSSPVPDRFVTTNARRIRGKPEKKAAAEFAKEENFLEDEMMMGSRSSGTEVKIKITKKQLEEILGNVKELSVQQVLAQLMNASNTDRTKEEHRLWRPNLQSIPE